MRKKGNVNDQDRSGDRCLERDLELDGFENKTCIVTWKKNVFISTLVSLFVSTLVNVAVQLLLKTNTHVQLSRDVEIIDSTQDPMAYALRGTATGETSNSPIGLVNVFLDTRIIIESFSSGDHKILWDTRKADTFISSDIKYNSSTGCFHISISGMYELNAKLTFWYDENTPRDEILYSTLLRNGIQITMDRFVFPSGVKTNFYHVQHNLWYLLQAGDTISVTATADSIQYLDSRWRASYFGIRLIQGMP